MLAHILRGKTLDEVRDRLDALDPQARNLADAIVQTSLRHYGEIRSLMGRHMKRPLPLRPHMAHALIVIGAAQLRFMGIAAHAAIHETVAASGRREQPFRGLINAVLRAIDKDATPTDPQRNLPDWMRARFEAAYGATQCAAILEAHATTPPLDICFKSAEKAAAFAATHDVDRLSDTQLRLTRPGAVPQLAGFHEGDWFVQDVAAGFAATMLHAALDTQGAARILDLCAAPGGKTMQLAAYGHDVTALDMSASRLARLANNLQRTGLTATLVEADALGWAVGEPYDAVLVDAPCSASGTLRRHPDLALHRREGYVAKLTALQTALLDKAASHVRLGGVLCYAVCSLDPAEGEAVAANFLATRSDFEKLSAQGVPAALLHNGWLRTTPADWAARGGMDGHFVALFKRTDTKISE